MAIQMPHHVKVYCFERINGLYSYTKTVVRGSQTTVFKF